MSNPQPSRKARQKANRMKGRADKARAELQQLAASRARTNREEEVTTAPTDPDTPFDDGTPISAEEYPAEEPARHIDDGAGCASVRDTRDTTEEDVSRTERTSDQYEQAVRDNATLATHTQRVSQLMAGLVSGDALDAMQFPPLQFVVDGLIPEGLTLLAGPPKVGKSWLVGHLCIVCAAGTPALGKIPTTARPVLYLALEDSHRRLQSRYRVLTDGEPIPAGLESHAGSLSWLEALALCRNWMDRHRDRKPLVVIDTFGKIKPQASSTAEKFTADYQAAGHLKALADAVPGSSVVVVHHTKKMRSEDFLEDLSGTNGIAGAADSIIVLRRPRTENDGTLYVPGRDIDEGAYAVTVDSGVWSLDGDTLTEAAEKAGNRKTDKQLSADMVACLGAVQSIWCDTRQPVPIAAVAKQAYGHWSDEVAAHKRARDYLARLKRDEQITSSKRGTYEPTTTYKAAHPIEP